MRPAEHDQVELAVGRVDRPARPDPARDEVAGVRDEREVTLDVEGLAVGVDPEVGGLEAHDLADRGADVRPEPHPAFPLVLGRGHDPGIEAHPAGDREDPLLGSWPVARPGVQRARPRSMTRGRPWRMASRPERMPRIPSEPARTLPVPAGTIASGVPRPMSAVAASRTVPSPPTATTSGASVASASAARVVLERRPPPPAGSRPVAMADRPMTAAGDPLALGRIAQLRCPRVDQDQRRGRVRRGRSSSDRC